MTSVTHWAKFYPPEWGGMERVTHDLATGMVAGGMPTTVVAFDRSGTARVKEAVDGVDVVRCPLMASPASQPLSLRWVVEAVRAARRSDAVLIHAPNPLAAVPLVIVRMLRLFSRQPHRIVMLWHADIIGKGALGVLIRPVEHLMALLSDRIIATSPPYAAASAILTRYAAKVDIVSLGIDPDLPDFGEPLDPEIQAFAAGRPLVLSVGRLVPYKGFDTLIDAAALGKGAFAVVIVGGGPLEADLKARVNTSGAAGSVMLVGRQSAARLDALFRAASLYALCSNDRAEAFGIVLLEAMAYGLPIVARDIPGSGAPWVAGDGQSAIVTRAGGAAAICDAIVSVCVDDAVRLKLGGAGRARLESQFTALAMTKGVASILETRA